jgi:hypothetical protein
MRRIGEGRVAGWLFGGPVPTTRGRLTAFVVGLALLVGVWRTTHSDGFQTVTLLALVFVVSPAIYRYRAGRGDEDKRPDRTASWRAYAIWFSFIVGWGAATWFLPGLGPWGWWWLVLIPSLEVFFRASKVDIEKRGGRPMREPKLVRASAVAGAATAPTVFLIIYLFDHPALKETVTTAIGCGIAVFLSSLVVGWFILRAQSASSSSAA